MGRQMSQTVLKTDYSQKTECTWALYGRNKTHFVHKSNYVHVIYFLGQHLWCNV